MAAARLNLPAVFLYGGSILPGNHNGQVLDIVSVFEAVGACAAGSITEEQLGQIERKACPTEGSCAGMFTANTMAAVAEALGMSLPGPCTGKAETGETLAFLQVLLRRLWLLTGRSDVLCNRTRGR